MNTPDKPTINLIASWLLTFGLLGTALYFAIHNQSDYATGCFFVAIYIVWFLIL